MKRITDHLGRWLRVPGNHARGFGVGLHIDVNGTIAHRFRFRNEAPVDGQGEHFLGDTEPSRSLPLHEFLGGQDFTPRRSRHVRNQAFHLTDLVSRDEFLEC
jgi:hypothetical protein